MKLTDKQIDFDFIGTQEPLSVEDKNLISEYFDSYLTIAIIIIH